MKTKQILIMALLAFHTLSPALFSTAEAQGTAFTYQGQLQSSGSPANGSYDLTLTLFTVSSGGSSMGTPFTNLATGVTNGLFTVAPNFGSGVFNGTTYWLEIAVRTNGGASFMTLAPRQQVTPAPYAIYTENAGDAAALVNGTALGAGSGNTISSSGATDAFIGDGTGDQIGAGSVYAAITGGQDNTIGANAGLSFIGGGQNNQTASGWSVIAGGNGNVIGGGILGSTIGGGYDNANNGNYATVPGGKGNVANGTYSFAAGQQAQALHEGAFVWADSENAPFASTANDQFSVRAQGGILFHTLCAGLTLDGPLYLPSLTSSCAPDIIYAGSSAYLLYADNDGNFFSGQNTGNTGTTGSANTATGQAALGYSTTGSSNVANGANALYNNSTGSENTALGMSALLNNTTGSNNIAVGYQAGLDIGAGNSNIDIGNVGESSDQNTIRIGNNQTAAYIAGAITGNGAGLTNISASQLNGSVNANLFVATSASSITYGSQNTAVGLGSLASNTSGADNTALGYEALSNNVGGGDNMAVGWEALTANVGDFNTGVGYEALNENSNGVNNTAIGFNALAGNLSGSENTATGSQSLLGNTQGSDNTATGLNTLTSNSGGSQNTATGASALYYNVLGWNNTADGYEALYQLGLTYFGVYGGTNNVGIGF
jgi:hypothetical protein